MTKLYLVRHGETVDNVNQILQGQTPGMLNDKGREQAQEVALRMKDAKIDAFVSSDLYRSIETCEIIAEPHGMQVRTTPLLRERDWGSFTGKFIPDLKDKTWPDDIETLADMKTRASKFMEWLKAEYPNKVVLAVGHGIINKAIQKRQQLCWRLKWLFFDFPMAVKRSFFSYYFRTIYVYSCDCSS